MKETQSYDFIYNKKKIKRIVDFQIGILFLTNK